ncbi:MAG: hypothetical protein HW384_92, partial [Dehalococcoidia bacterium]|nr:hypothetical protein [Dehalococcoidia bacterium]
LVFIPNLLDLHTGPPSGYKAFDCIFYKINALPLNRYTPTGEKVKFRDYP